MAKLIYGSKTLLKDMKYLSSTLEISVGLMFASMNKIRRGVCIVMPLRKDKRFASSVTMLFVFHKLEVLFLDSSFKVVDKVVLNPFVFSYTPRMAAKYIIESNIGRFKGIKIGDQLKIIR